MPKSNSFGFTLIELLIVIGVIGVLAVLVIVGINPVQQLARGRDAGRKIIVGQLSKAVQAYYTSNNSTYPVGSGYINPPVLLGDWIATLVNSGEIKKAPNAVPYKTGVPTCRNDNDLEGNSVNGWCYRLNSTSTEAMVYTALESDSERNKCPGSGGTTSCPHAVFMWDSKRDSTCVVCVPCETNINKVAFDTPCKAIQ